MVLYFSGHGGQQRCADDDYGESDGRDETILPVDHLINGAVTDDELNAELVSLVPRGVRLLCIMDCCHAGTGNTMRRLLIPLHRSGLAVCPQRRRRGMAPDASSGTDTGWRCYADSQLQS